MSQVQRADANKDINNSNTYAAANGVTKVGYNDGNYL